MSLTQILAAQRLSDDELQCELGEIRRKIANRTMRLAAKDAQIKSWREKEAVYLRAWMRRKKERGA